MTAPAQTDRSPRVQRILQVGLVLVTLAVIAELTFYPHDSRLDWVDIIQESLFLLAGFGALWAARKADSIVLAVGAVMLTGSLALDLGDEFILPAPLPSEYVPMVLSAGGLGGLIWGLADLAAREREGRRKLQVSERQIERYQAQLEVASMKDEFVATMSHELRTPLTAVIGAADLLNENIDGTLTEEQRSLVGTISGSAEHLLAIINDILELSRLAAGRAALARESVDIVACCDNAWALVEARAQAKWLDASINVPKHIGRVFTDGRRLKQVLINLLDNAVKFTPAGGKIGLDVARDDHSGDIAFCVWDSGAGIPEEDRERVFEPFVQLDAGLNREHQGTGLGLALVRRTARALGGDATLTSAPTGGCRFNITIPVNPPA